VLVREGHSLIPKLSLLIYFGALGVCGKLPQIMGMWLETFYLWISANAFDDDFFGKHKNIQTLILYRIRSQ